MSINVAQELDVIYKNRCINSINPNSIFTIIESQSKQYVQIYDTNVTKDILESKKLAVFNYYQDGMTRLKEKEGHQISILEKFWQESPLFLNNQPHKQLKVELQKEIIFLENYFKKNEGDINNLLEFYATTDCPIQLSKDITNIIIANLIAHISKTSFSACLEFIKKREPVFFSYFHTVKQSIMAKNIEEFFTKNNLENIPPTSKLLICSLTIMGVDPIISMIAGHALGKMTKNDCFDIPSVGYITRISTSEITIFNQEFAPGTIFNLSLTPNQKQYESRDFIPINFGLGAHKCLGATLAKLIVDSSIRFLNRKNQNDIKPNYKITSEGAFLKFKKI